MSTRASNFFGEMRLTINYLQRILRYVRDPRFREFYVNIRVKFADIRMECQNIFNVSIVFLTFIHIYWDFLFQMIDQDRNEALIQERRAYLNDVRVHLDFDVIDWTE